MQSLPIIPSPPCRCKLPTGDTGNVTVEDSESAGSDVPIAAALICLGVTRSDTAGGPQVSHAGDYLLGPVPVLNLAGADDLGG